MVCRKASTRQLNFLLCRAVLVAARAAVASMDIKPTAADSLQQFLANKAAMQLRQETLLSIMVSGCIAPAVAGLRQGCDVCVGPSAPLH